jgi:hypothetical protein
MGNADAVDFPDFLNGKTSATSVILQYEWTYLIFLFVVLFCTHRSRVAAGGPAPGAARSDGGEARHNVTCGAVAVELVVTTDLSLRGGEYCCT